MSDINCATCGNLRFDPSFKWRGTKDSEKEETFFIMPTVPDLQSSASQGCCYCGLIIDSVSFFEDISALFSEQSYGNPRRISARSKVGTALCLHSGKGLIIELFLDREAEEVPNDFAIGTGSSIDPNLDCRQATSFIQASLNACTAVHNDCARINKQVLPKRLLHVGTKQGTGFSDPYLVEDLKDDVPYVALSYCWGRKPFRRMTNSTLEQDKRGINLENLPKTFQNAITLLRALGICYLWIDAMCIIQGDLDDWKIEGAKMDQVYAHALFVISVTFGKDVHCGFLSNNSGQKDPDSATIDARDARRASVTEHRLSCSIDGREIKFHVRKKLQHDSIVNNLLANNQVDASMPVLSRAWCLQERLLAARMVHFTSEEMIWECSDATWCECRGSELDAFTQQFESIGSIPSSRVTTPLSAYKALFRGQITGKWQLANLWQHTVSAYTWRDLTYQSDRLPALSGIVALFQGAGMGTYLAGLWRENLAHYLHWHSTRCSRYVKRISQPSWSWASVDGPVLWGTDCSELKATVTILSAEVELEESTGQVVSGTIEVIGQVIEANIILEWFDAGLRPDESFAALAVEGKEIPLSLDVAQFPPGAAERQRPDIVNSQISTGEQVTCLMILTGQTYPYVLILKRSPIIADAYERVGICESRMLTKFFTNSHSRRLKLV